MRDGWQRILVVTMVLIAGALFCSTMAGATETIKMGVAGAHSGEALTKQRGQQCGEARVEGG